MTAFLTSSPGGSIDNDCTRPCAFNNDNGFVERLKALWTGRKRLLIIASSPSCYEINDSVNRMLSTAFEKSGLPLECSDTCDDRNPKMSVELINSYDVVLLSGGHVPTESEFFNRIGLKECISQYQGIVIGISAGTMNSAEQVYAMPELDGESLDPEYKRFIPGLGISNVMIIPHYQYMLTVNLDGRRSIQDIACEDSVGRDFYGIVDGSYLLVENGHQIIYGETYHIHDGIIEKVCDINECIEV